MAAIFIHVGYGKCGSTAIQRWLEQNAGELRGEGAFVCGTFLQHCPNAPYRSVPEMVRAMRDAPDTPDTIHDALAAAATEKSPVIWSVETLQRRYGLMTPIIRRLKEAGHDVRVVVYLRNHASWLLSAYAQWGIKHPTSRRKEAPFIMSFEEFAEHRSADLDYLSVLANWEATGATVMPRSYDALDDVVDDFARVVGLTGRNDGRRANPPLQTSTLALLKGLQSVRRAPATIGSFERMLRNAKLADAGIAEASVDLVALDEAELNALHATFAAQREVLRERYGVDLDETAPRNVLARDNPSNDDLVAILSLVCFSLHERVEALEAALAART
ncbi:hypothetical protein [Acuticoccus sp. I52.16.1]|uniref:hypothetical protein n=1 Tax=Acuticoccus sp. I52.16.1 TaxID=2928472 RepID=UPI001FD2FC3E|nr:hypothetical protein [Acuticoccus sp. I52.16.1]UOM33957.1 hypothetical protein MRB58_19290 [Acuticoccus sp. I52.16.1]